MLDYNYGSHLLVLVTIGTDLVPTSTLSAYNMISSGRYFTMITVILVHVERKDTQIADARHEELRSSNQPKGTRAHRARPKMADVDEPTVDSKGRPFMCALTPLAIPLEMLHFRMDSTCTS